MDIFTIFPWLADFVVPGILAGIGIILILIGLMPIFGGIKKIVAGVLFIVLGGLYYLISQYFDNFLIAIPAVAIFGTVLGILFAIIAYVVLRKKK